MFVEKPVCARGARGCVGVRNQYAHRAIATVFVYGIDERSIGDSTVVGRAHFVVGGGAVCCDNCAAAQRCGDRDDSECRIYVRAGVNCGAHSARRARACVCTQLPRQQQAQMGVRERLYGANLAWSSAY